MMLIDTDRLKRLKNIFSEPRFLITVYHGTCTNVKVLLFPLIVFVQVQVQKIFFPSNTQVIHYKVMAVAFWIKPVTVAPVASSLSNRTLTTLPTTMVLGGLTVYFSAISAIFVMSPTTVR